MTDADNDAPDDTLPDEDGLIGIDWKFVGRDYLGFFPEHYPGLACFRGAAFERLCDDLANELPENCFPGLSALLAAHGHELWNIDTQGDEYLLLVAPAGQGAAQCRAMLGEVEDEIGEHYRFERLAPDARAAATTSVPKVSRKPKKPPPIEEAHDPHLGYGGVWRAGARYDMVEFEDEDGGAFQSVVDLHSFPMKGVDADGFHDLIDTKHNLTALYAVEGGQYWHWEKPQKRRKVWGEQVQSLAFITDYAAPVIAEVEHSERRAGMLHDTRGIGNCLFQKVSIVGDEPWFDPGVPDFGDILPEAEISKPVALLKIEGLKTRHIATVRLGTSVLPLSETEVALFEAPFHEEDQEPGGLNYALLNTETRTQGPVGTLPPDPHLDADSMFVLSADEIAFVRRKTQDHPTHPNLKEATGWLTRFNVRTGAWQEAKLDGLHDDYQVNMAFLRGQAADRHRVRSFDGSIDASKGHDDWWALNYLTSASGKHDLAWLWNSARDEVVRIGPDSFPRREVTIHYIAALDRYIADESCNLSLLVPFDEIYASRERLQLQWQAG